ncbi:MAG: prephenate dehydrogenase [Desulfarculus sp.]|nr:prephenate dehydrogenase [Desulfarculus sp.]
MDDPSFSQDPPFTRPLVGIIGGQGRMGRWLKARLEEDGHQVRVADRGHGPPPCELAAACPVLILAVPVPAVAQVMAAIGPFTRTDGLLLDIASLKQAPLEAMLAHARGEVIGGHPLCGPTAPSLAGQVFFVCPGRGSRWWAWLQAWLGRAGAQAVEITAASHDRLMAQVQTLRHMLLLGLGHTLREVGFKPARDLPLAGPWFGSLVGLLEHQGQQPADLYADLALNNPAAPAMLAALAQGLARIAQMTAAGDRQGLVEMMDQVRDYLGGGGPAKNLPAPPQRP